MATHQQVLAAAFALCPHLCALKGCDHLNCTPDESVMRAARDAVEAYEKVKPEELFALTLTQPAWPHDWEKKFRDHYPRNVAMAMAIRKLAVIKKSKKVSFEVLLAGVDRYAASVAGTEMQHICHPTTWLTGERWNDHPKSLANGVKNRKNGFAAIVQDYYNEV